MTREEQFKEISDMLAEIDLKTQQTQMLVEDLQKDLQKKGVYKNGNDIY